MDCKQIRVYLSEYLDNELSPQLREEVDRHLAECADCRQYLTAMRSVGDVLDKDQFELPDNFADSFAAKLAEAKKKKAKPRPLYRKVWFGTAVAAACLLICLGVAGVFQGWSQDSQNEAIQMADSAELDNSEASAPMAYGYGDTDTADGSSSQNSIPAENKTENSREEDSEVTDEQPVVGDSEQVVSNTEVDKDSAPAAKSFLWLIVVICLVILCVIILRLKNKKSKI